MVNCPICGQEARSSYRRSRRGGGKWGDVNVYYCQTRTPVECPQYGKRVTGAVHDSDDDRAGSAVGAVGAGGARRTSVEGRAQAAPQQLRGLKPRITAAEIELEQQLEEQHRNTLNRTAAELRAKLGDIYRELRATETEMEELQRDLDFAAQQAPSAPPAPLMPAPPLVRSPTPSAPPAPPPLPPPAPPVPTSLEEAAHRRRVLAVEAAAGGGAESLSAAERRRRDLLLSRSWREMGKEMATSAPRPPNMPGLRPGHRTWQFTQR